MGTLEEAKAKGSRPSVAAAPDHSADGLRVVVGLCGALQVEQRPVRAEA